MPWLPEHASLVALRYRNFRLLWLGNLVSFAGSMMRQTAVLWHVSLLVPPKTTGTAHIVATTVGNIRSEKSVSVSC